MSFYEQALEEWKKRDPHLLDFEGFQKFLDNKRIIADHIDNAFIQRERYCTQKLLGIIVEHVLSKEFGDITEKPIDDWQDFYEMAQRYLEVKGGLGDWLPFDTVGLHRVEKTLGITLNLRFAYDTWRRLIHHPEWFADWDVAYGSKGYSGSAYRLKIWLALCVKLGLEDKALEIMNNLPEELRHPPGVPDYVKTDLETESWKDTYKCRSCRRPTCEGCVPYIPSLRLFEE